MKKLFYLIVNAWKYREFLINFREWRADDSVVEFLNDFSKVMIKFYSSPSDSDYGDDNRIKILEEINNLDKMLHIANDSTYYMRDIDIDIDTIWTNNKFNSESLWSDEEIKEAHKKYKDNRINMFLYIEKHIGTWYH